MKVLKKSGQKYPINVNRMRGDYEIRTFTGIPRNHSHIEVPQIIRRSPNRIFEQGTSESALGEIFYLEPSEANYRRGQNMSPLNNSHNLIMRSPYNLKRNDYVSGGVVNMAQRINFSQNPKLQMNYEEKRERSRSPKTINIGESPEEMEYNIKTFNKRVKNVDLNSPQNNIIDRSYNMMLNDTGNIFLDQPMQQAYNQSNDFFNSSIGMIPQGINEQRSFNLNNREIQFGINPRDMQEPIPGILKKMSPKGNVEGDSDSNSEKNDNINQIRDLKSQLDRNVNVMFKNEDGIGIGDKNMQNRGDMENLEIMAKTREFQENITGEEVKKLIKYYVKTYDPHKGEDGNLISNSQTIILSNPDQLFQDRYKVLQKMNKLSNILLAKKRNVSPDSENLNRSFGEDRKNRVNIGTLNNTIIKDVSKKTNRNAGKKKFLYVSLAMLSAKGPNTEDRIILRKMRLDKGGVVDLAQETLQKKNKFKIKKARAGGRGITSVNMKYREKAAKIVQAWWRERKEKYKRILEQIIKIQSVWRGKFTRKYIYDVIYISFLQDKFLSIMRNVLVNHVRPIVFNELFSKNKLIKDILRDLLLKYEEKMDYLRVQSNFLKWKNASDILTKRISISKELLFKKEKNENKLTKLKKYFDKWALLKNLYKYIGKSNDAEEKAQKFFGTINIVNGLSSLSKRQIFRNTREPIFNYLKDLLKQKLLIKIIKKIFKKCLELKLKNYLNDWRIAASKKKFDDFKNEVFLRTINHIDSRLDKKKIKYYFDKWRKHIPQTKKIFEIKKGGDILNKFIIKNTLDHPLQAFAERLDEDNDKKIILKLLTIKKKKLKDDIKNYFIKWKNNLMRLYDKDKRNELYVTLLKNLINKINNRILYKRFNQWRLRQKSDSKLEMKKINDFSNKLYDTFKNHYNEEYKSFLDKLFISRDEHSLKKAANKLFKIFNNKRKAILRYYLFKWRSQIKNDELKELHKQLLKYIIVTLNSKNKRNDLGKYFTRWRLIVGEKKNYDHFGKFKNVLKGGDLLDNLYKRRLRDLIIRLYRIFGKDYRPKILGNLIKDLDKPRSTIRECFDRWKKVLDDDKNHTNISKYKAKLININIDSIIKRNKRDKLIRAFYRWKVMTKKPDEYYPKVNNLLNSLKKYVTKRAVSSPFDQIKITRNPTRYLLKILKNYKNQENRILNGKLRNIIGRWRSGTNDNNTKNLKTKILYNIKIYLDESQKKKLLSKYFTIWRLNCRKKGLDYNFVKGIDKLSQILKAPLKREIFNAYINKMKNIQKQNGIKNLVKTLAHHKNKILKNIIMEWWRKVMTTVPNKKTKITTKLIKIIKYNEMEPRLKAFRKWAKIVRISKLKDKDLNNALNILSGVFRHNDKMNVYNAFSLWKNKIHILREQYLKALLIRQIKSKQNLKEKMSNEAKLRKALLKWRKNLISMNYLDSIKQIRKGCKLFKLGLKRLHERQILNNIQKYTNQNKKDKTLKKIVTKIIPGLYAKKIKNIIDIWKSKLGDTQKMKNKMKNLLDNYVNSNSSHQELFEKPKNDIIKLFRDYDDKRKDAQQKINNFSKGIFNIRDQIKKMILNKLLHSIIKKKDEHINDIKKIKFFGFYRQTQKLKNKDNANAIQNFIKKKLRKLINNKKLINDGLGKFKLYIKRKCLNKIKDSSKKKYIVIILKKCVDLKRDNKNELLRNKLREWRNKIPLFKKIDAIIKIQNTYRKYYAKNALNGLKLRKSLLFKIYENNENKNKIKLMALLRDWLHRALKTKNNEAATKIQRIFKKRIEMNKTKNAKDKLKNLLDNYIKHQIGYALQRVSKVLGGKGLPIYRILQDILYRNPFNKLINNINFIRRVNELKKIQPKIHDIIKKYYLQKALKKWKENTYDQTIKNVIILQKFLRDQYNKKKERDKEERELLLFEIVNRKIINNSYKLKIPFNIWKKKVKLEKINEEALKLQNNFRKYIAGEKAKELKASDKYLNLVNNLKKKFIINIIKKIKDNKIKEDNRKKKLTKILSKKIFINEKANLENCFNKWKNINKKSKENATHIENAFRVYKAKKERNRLNKINYLLKKYLLKHEKKDEDNKKSKLRKWNNKSNLLQIIEKVLKIQKFIKPKLAKIRNDKFKQFFKKNGKKKIYKLLLLTGKLNKLQKAVHKQNIRKFLNNLKNIKKDKNRNDKLKRTINKRNKIIKNILLKKCIEKWKEQDKKLKKKINNSALKIQSVFKGFKAKSETDRLLTRKKIIRKYILKKDNTINNKLYSALRKWIYIVRNLICNENAKIIQQNWRKFQDKLNKDIELGRKLKIKNGLEKLFNIKFGGKFAINKLKEEINRNIFNIFNASLKNKRLTLLKDCFEKIKKKGFNEVLKKAIKVPDLLKRRIIKKALSKWKNQAEKLGKKRSIEIITKNWEIYSNNKKQKNKKEILKKILSKIILKKSNILKTYFIKWYNTAKNLQIFHAKQSIAKFFTNKYKIGNAFKNWQKLCNKYKIKDRNNNLFQIIKKIKQAILLNKFKRPFVKRARKNLFDKIKENKKNTNIYLKYSKLITKINEKNNNNILKKYLLKWKNNLYKIKNRENKLEKALNAISNRLKINGTDYINSAIIIKKLFHDIPLIRAKAFINKIKEIAIQKYLYNNLTEDILKSKDNLNNQKKEKFLNKIYKLYAYNKIISLINVCKKYDNRIKNIYGKDFLNKLIGMKSNFLAYKYNNKLESSNQPKIIKMKFKNKIGKNDKIFSEQNAPMRKVLPNLIKYIEKLIRRRKEETFEKVKTELIRNNFKKLLKKFNNRIIEPNKKEFVKKFKREANFSETRPIYQSKLYRIFRKKYIKTIRKTLVQPSRLYNLFYLINMTKMHINIAAQRYYREIIRKWRFITFTKKMARKKLELMYKNLHASYLQMADEIFGEDRINPSVFKEFERFGSNVGMFTGQEPEIDEELNKKYYSAIDKKYVFTNKASVILNEAEDIKKDEYIEQIKEDNAQEEVIKHSLTQSPKTIKEKFDSIKKKGLSSKYFEKK